MPWNAQGPSVSLCLPYSFLSPPPNPPPAGDRDTISPPADVALLKAALAPGVVVAHHADPDYGHLDYELGSDAPDRYYPAAVSLAQQAAAASGA